MEKILVSACLVGDKTRYDGKSAYSPSVMELNEKFDFILVCPEVFGGLKTPRPAAEIVGDRVINMNNKDVTASYIKGIEQVKFAVKYWRITKAILKENSPACGVHKIHSGKFDGKLIDGQGLLTQTLINLGVEVYNEKEVDELLK